MMTWIITNRADFLKGALFILLMSCAIYGCQHGNDFFGLTNDHPAEQALEAYIKDKTGIELDLTPGDD